MGLILGDSYNEVVNEKSLAIAVMSLLCYVYVRGVKDACNARDEMLCRDFIRKTDEAGVFGFLWKDRDARFDMNTWNDRDFICELMSFAYAERVPGMRSLVRYMQRILNPNIYHYCLLHVAQEFYKQGMLAYMKYPNQTKLFTITQHPNNATWGKNGAKVGNRQDTLHRIHEACRDRSLRCEETIARLAEEGNNKNKYVTSRNRFDNFQKSLWQALNNEERGKNKNQYRVVEKAASWRAKTPVERKPTSGRKRGRPPKNA